MEHRLGDRHRAAPRRCGARLQRDRGEHASRAASGPLLGAAAIEGLAPAGVERRITTQLADGRAVTVRHEALEALLHVGIGRLVGEGAGFVILLCTGDFPSLASPVPALVPGVVLRRLVATMVPGSRIAVVVPLPEQVEDAERRWAVAGCAATAMTASPFEDDVALDVAAQRLAATAATPAVLDCFAYGARHRERIRRSWPGLVLLPQELVFATALQLLR